MCHSERAETKDRERERKHRGIVNRGAKGAIKEESEQERMRQREKTGSLPSAHKPGNIELLFSTERAALLSNYIVSPITGGFVANAAWAWSGSCLHTSEK